MSKGKAILKNKMADVGKLPKKFGDDLKDGKAFKHLPKIPMIMAKGDMKGEKLIDVAPNNVPNKLVPPEWSENTKTNFQRRKN